MLFLDKTRALDLIISNSERISVPEPYRLEAVTAFVDAVGTDSAATRPLARPWAWAVNIPVFTSLLDTPQPSVVAAAQSRVP